MTTTAPSATQPTSASVQRSSPAKPQDTSWFGVLKRTVSTWLEDKAPKLSAALACYTIIALAPLMLITVIVVSFILRSKENAQGLVLQQASSLMGENGKNVIGQIIHNSSGGGHGFAAIVSFAVLLFSASGVFAELQDSMNIVWHVQPKPNRGIWGLIRDRFLSLAMVFGIAFLLLASLFVSTALTAVAQHLMGGAKVVAFLLDIFVSCLVVFALFAAIFKFLPDVKLKWGDVWAGAAVTTVLFIVGKYLLAWYLKAGSSSTSPYGALGAPIALLLWIYYSSMILFFGAEFTKAYVTRGGQKAQTAENAVPLSAAAMAEKGMPRKAALEAAAQNRPVRPQPSMARPAMARAHEGADGLLDGDGSRRAAYIAAAGGLAIGALVGGLGAQAVRDRRQPARKHLAAVALDQRLQNIEQRLGRVSRIKEYLRDQRVYDRVNEMEKRIRAVSQGVRSETTGRPRWMVRLADMIAGTK